MKIFAMLMVFGGILITGLSVVMAAVNESGSTSFVISIIDIVVGVVMIFLGAAFLAGRKK